ncbi:putative carboxylesterase 17 [Wolffia australiana]
MEVVAEIPGFLKVFSDGTIKRFTPKEETFQREADGAPLASPPPAFKFRDVVIDAAKHISARIFYPSKDGETPTSQLPLLVYFHGGGFCVGTTTWHGFHAFLGGLCVQCRCVVISVDYRLAPEHRLPVAYDDCYAALEWLTEPRDEPWVRAADLSRVFLAGESAGGNIVHHMTLRLMRNPVRGLGLSGLLIIHPFFGGEARMAEETAEAAQAWVQATDMFWRLSLPEGADRDHPFCRVENGLVSDDEGRRFPRVTVFLAGKDVLKSWGNLYATFLRSKGAKEVTVLVAEEEIHAHHIFFPLAEATRLLQSQMADFVHRQDAPPVPAGIYVHSKC